MKECTSDLAVYLNTKTELKACNLYQIRLLNGYVMYVTDFDKDVIWENHVFQHDKFIIERSQTKCAGTPEVDTMNITVYADKDHNDLANNVFILEAIHKGMFDTSSLTIWRAFFDAEADTTNDGQLRPYGAIKLFTGRMELTECNVFCAKFSVKAEITGLNASLPLRTFQAQTSYANNNGSVIEYSGDTTTCVVPLKPSSNVLYQL